MSVFSNGMLMATKFTAPPGQVTFVSPLSTDFSWVVPEGVYSICAVCIAGGGVGGNAASSGGAGGGGGGELAYKNNIVVVPGETLTLRVGRGIGGGAGGNGISSYVKRGASNLLLANPGLMGGSTGSGAPGGQGQGGAGGGVATGANGGSSGRDGEVGGGFGPGTGLGGGGGGAGNYNGTPHPTGSTFSPAYGTNELGDTTPIASGLYGAGGKGGGGAGGGGGPENGKQGVIRIVWGEGKSYPSNAKLT